MGYYIPHYPYTSMGCDVPERLTETLDAIRRRFSGRDVTATVDERGRLTIKEDDRKALGIEGERALLDLHAVVLETGLEPKRTDGGEPVHLETDPNSRGDE